MQPRVLFVDDEPHVTEALRRVLKKAPYKILTASSADEALQILTQVSVDVVVSDERMPGMAGSELLARTSAHEAVSSSKAELLAEKLSAASISG